MGAAGRWRHGRRNFGGAIIEKVPRRIMDGGGGRAWQGAAVRGRTRAAGRAILVLEKVLHAFTPLTPSKS